MQSQEASLGGRREADGLTLDEFKAEQAMIRHGIQVAEQKIATWSVELDSITQALDDALPEGLQLILVQTVFEKLWVLDSEVVGSELTEPFAELLTLEARLAWTKGQTTTRMDPQHDEDSAYYRRRLTPPSLRAMEASWNRPYAERPRGSYPEIQKTSTRMGVEVQTSKVRWVVLDLNQ